jgi:hypothetical protein
MSIITSQVVLDHYSALAREDATKNTDHIKKVAESFGYSAEDLAGIPEEANLGVSCGNPLAVAGLKAVSCLPTFFLIPILHMSLIKILVSRDNVLSRAKLLSILAQEQASMSSKLLGRLGLQVFQLV